MILPLTLYAHPVLRQKGSPVRQFNEELRELVSDMLETMRENRGIGLAAQQIGLARQVAVVDITGIEDRPSSMTVNGETVDPLDFMPLYLINASVEGTKAKDSGVEGCLSFPGLRFPVLRSRRVKVVTHGLDGQPMAFEAAGLLAIVIQHEFDHLQGRLYIDHLSMEDRRKLKDKLAAIERGEILQDQDDDDEDEES